MEAFPDVRIHPLARAPRRRVARALAAVLPLLVIAPAHSGAAGAPAAPEAAAPALRAAAPTLRIADRRLRFGEAVVARGAVGAADAGRRVVLQHRPTGGRWRAVAHGAVRPDGRYRLRAPLRGSGAVRVVVAADDRTAAAAQLQASPARRVAVAARLLVRRRTHDVRAGAAVRVRGVLLPRDAGRRVTVEGRVRGRWRALAHARTRRDGHFAARVVVRSLGATPLRVRSARSRANLATTAAAGALRGFRAALASWYGLYGGPLACGGTLGYGQLGVAHKTLPCGTKVTIRHRGRTVTVPVIDRGPYVGGREWDLTGATARALGFSGVGTVWTTA